MIRIAVVGSSGRMGQMLIEAIEACGAEFEIPGFLRGIGGERAGDLAFEWR